MSDDLCEAVDFPLLGHPVFQRQFGTRQVAHEGGELHEVRVEALRPRLTMGVLQMSQEAGLVLLSVPTGGADRVDTFHVFNELVGHFKDLLTVIAGQELARGLVLAVVNPQVELLAEGDLAVPTLELVLPLKGQMFFPHMILEDGQVMRSKDTLCTVVAVTEVVVVDESVDLVVGGRHSTVRLHFLFNNGGCFVNYVADVATVVVLD